jgi:hypothetical protein
MYWIKGYTCGHMSRIYIDYCIDAARCKDRCQDPPVDPTPRKSHFLCYDCIREETLDELKVRGLATKKKSDMETAEEKKSVAGENVHQDRTRHERLRKAHKDRAVREREEDTRKKREGNVWQSIVPKYKTYRGRKGGASLTPIRPGFQLVNGAGRRDGMLPGPASAPASRTLFESLAMGGGDSDNGNRRGSGSGLSIDTSNCYGIGNSTNTGTVNSTGTSKFHENTKGGSAPPSVINPGGRAGYWGPSSKSTRDQ